MKCLEFVYFGVAFLCRPVKPHCGPLTNTRMLKIIFKNLPLLFDPE